MDVQTRTSTDSSIQEFEHLSQSPELLAAASLVDGSMGQTNTVFPGFFSG